jgi:hypothetical protein
MSTILNGVIEVYDEYAESWFFVMDTFQIFYQDYDIFALLFDVRNYIQIEPIAPNRGLPNDISQRTKQEFESKYDSDFTFITYKELTLALKSEIKSKIISIQSDDHGKIIEEGFSTWEKINFEPHELFCKKGKQEIWLRDGRYFVNREKTSKEILNSNREFKLLMRIMNLINEKHKMERIRWIVSFTT